MFGIIAAIYSSFFLALAQGSIKKSYKDFTQMQKEIFNYVWNLGEKPIIGKNGRTSMF